MAYDYALHVGLKKPANWERDKMAGSEWMFSFMKRHSNLSLRSPENTSLASATVFKQTNVNELFELYTSV